MGDNLGWPTIHHADKKAGLVSPLIEFTPAIAPASGTFYNADLFPTLKGHYLIGALRGTALLCVTLDASKVSKVESLVKNYGRVRAITVAPDGSIYFSTSNKDGRGRAAKDDDRILRLVPEPKDAVKPDEKPAPSAN